MCARVQGVKAGSWVTRGAKAPGAVVRRMRATRHLGKRMLAIGDGANDVAMIQVPAAPWQPLSSPLHPMGVCVLAWQQRATQLH